MLLFWLEVERWGEVEQKRKKLVTLPLVITNIALWHFKII